MNIFNVLTFIQVHTDKNKFMQIRNINTFNVLTFIQIRTDKNRLMQEAKQRDENTFLQMI